MIRILGVALAAGLLAACSSGDSFLEWDPETQAMLDAQAAQAEAAANQGRLTDEEILAQGEPGDGAVVALAGLQAPLVLLDANGAIMQGQLVRGDTGVQVIWSDGVSCSGGLVKEADLEDGPQASAGTFALNCNDGTIWPGKYADLAPGHGAWTMRNARSLEARAVYGSDVPASPVDAVAFESLWASRATTPAG